MARPRRRTGKNQKTPEPAGATDDDAQVHAVPDAEGADKSQDEKCPACKDDAGEQTPEAADKEKWVRCDACKTWFHWRCAGEGDLDAVDKWCACVPSRPLNNACSVVMGVQCVGCSVLMHSDVGVPGFADRVATPTPHASLP